MALAIRCPNCKKSLSVPDEAVGKMVSCPSCQAAFAIAQPAEETAPTVTAAPAAAWDKESRADRHKRKGKRRADEHEDDRDDDDDDDDDHEAVETPPSANPFALDNEQDGSTRPPWRPHRGGLILALGIISIVTGCLPMSLITVSMANVDLIEMAAQRMDPEGRSQTKTGKLLAVISLLITLVMIPFFCCLGILGSGRVRM